MKKFGKLIKRCHDNEPEAICEWCKEDWPLSELKKEKNLGLLCPQCIEAIRSRGEKLTIEDSKIKDSGNKPISELAQILPNLYTACNKLKNLFEFNFMVRNEDGNIKMYEANEAFDYEFDYRNAPRNSQGLYEEKYYNLLNDAFIKDGGDYIEWENSVIMQLVFEDETLGKKVANKLEGLTDDLSKYRPSDLCRIELLATRKYTTKSGKTGTMSLLEYTPVGAELKGEDIRDYAVVNDYNGEDIWTKGAIVDVNLKSAIRTFHTQLELAENED